MFGWRSDQVRGGVVDVARRIIVEHSVIEINRITSSLIERLSSIAENDRSKSNSPNVWAIER